MKRKRLLGFLVALMSVIFNLSAEYYCVTTKSNVNLREGPSTSTKVLTKISAGTALFMDGDSYENGFYKVYYLGTELEGYISEKYLNLKDKQPIQKGGLFSIFANNFNLEEPAVEVFNDTPYLLKLKINSKTYKIKAHRKQQIKLTSGVQRIEASVPVAMPFFGVETAEKGYIYSWKFYLQTQPIFLPRK